MKRIVTIGGGSGQFAILDGLKKYSQNNPTKLAQSFITAIVATSDNGGSTGEIIKERIPKMGEGKFLPPGDITRCLLALANNKEKKEFYDFRPKSGIFKGHTMRNIFMDLAFERFGDFEKALQFLKSDLDVKGDVIPCTLEMANLCAELDNGETVEGQVAVSSYRLYNKAFVRKLFLLPQDVKPNQKAINAILSADVIILSAGSLYTSLLPNLVVPGIADAIRQSKAKKAYVVNLATQRGETDDFTAARHVEELERYLGKDVLTHVIVNSKEFPEDIKRKYDQKWQHQVVNDLTNGGFKMIESDYVLNEGIARHNAEKIAQVVVEGLD